MFREAPMTITLDLSTELERKLSSEAGRQGLSVEQYALQLLAEPKGALQTQEPIRTGGELVAYWEREGLVGTRLDILDPTAHARELRQQAETRRASSSQRKLHSA